MHKIDRMAFNQVRKIFADLESFQPMCTAVLEGVWPGQVWVDDEANPSTALLTTFLSGGGAAWCFLAGDPANQHFNAALNKAIFEEKIAGKDVGTFLFTCHPGDWSGNLSQVGHPRPLAPVLRRHYICRELTYDPRGSQAEGTTIRPMDTALLKDDRLKLSPEVDTTLSKWDSIKEHNFKDYGFVAVQDGQVVAWATVDFVAAGKGDLGFETLVDYRKCGLGSAVAAVALEYGLANGIEVHWTCAEDNIGSQRTAEKLGLERDRDYTMYVFSMDLQIHTAQLAYTKLAAGQYQQAIDLYEGLFAQEANLPGWAYFDTAQACAALKQGDKALKYLRIAVKQGWSEVAMIENAEEFVFLHGTPEWQSLMKSMHQGKADQ